MPFKKNPELLCLAATLLLPVVILVSLFISPAYIDYNRWDNFEYFTPIIEYSQDLWMSLEIPFWNPHQFMGEPLLGIGQAGPFYLGYFFSVLIVKLLHLPPGSLCFVIMLLHAPVSAMGWYLLLRSLSVRRSLSLMVSICITFGGFITIISFIFIFMMPVFALFPFALWALVLMHKGRSLLGSILFVVSLIGQVSVGHAQMFVYSFFFILLYSIAFSLILFKKKAMLINIFVLFIFAGLISSPIYLPIIKCMKYSSRIDAFTLEGFLARGYSSARLVGTVLPAYTVKMTTLALKSTMCSYQGAWFVPSFLAGILLLLNGVKIPEKKTGKTDGNNSDTFLKKCFVATLIPAIIALLFSLGKNGLIYGLTYHIPVWSSFRWPYKFCCYSFPALAVTAGVGLEMWCRKLADIPIWSKFRILAGPSIAVVSLLLLFFIKTPGIKEPLCIISIITGLMIMVMVSWLDQPKIYNCFIVLNIINITLFVAYCHSIEYQRFGEKWGSVKAADLHIDPSYRIIPVSPMEKWDNKDFTMQWQALNLSATGNGYRCATGIPFGLLPENYLEHIKCNVSGALTPDVHFLLNSNLLFSYNIKYAIASVSDFEAVKALQDSGIYSSIFKNDKVIVAENSQALPLAYFASRTLPFSGKAFEDGMLNNEVPATTAFVKGYDKTIINQGTVKKVCEGPSEVTIEIEAKDGGFLVLANSYHTDWIAAINGEPTKIYLVNDRTMGVEIPAGANEVVFRYYSKELIAGLYLSGLSITGLILWLRFTRKSNKNV